jgi:protease I
MVKVLFIIAHRNYQDLEFLNPKKVLEGFDIVVSSSEKSLAKGVFGGSYVPDFSNEEVLKILERSPDEFSALVLIGGGGAIDYFDDEIVHDIIKKMDYYKKVISAICIAPKILALSGVLKGKKATVWDPGDNSIIDELKSMGVLVLDEPVVVDERFITANGPSASEEFGKMIKKKLEGLKC